MDIKRETQTQNLNVPERSLIVNEQSNTPKKVNFDNNTTQFEALVEDNTLDMDSTLVSSLSCNHDDNNTEVETEESPDVSPSADQTETKTNLNYEEIQQAIMEISSEFISGNLSGGNLMDEDSDSSHLSSDLESRRLKSSVAKYPENASGLSDNDWNPYTTESDSNLTPRMEPQAKKITEIAEIDTESEVVKEQHFNGKESDISSFSPQLSSSKFTNNENSEDKPTPPFMETVKEETKSEISNFSPALTSSRAQSLKHDPVSSYFPASTSCTSSLTKSSSTNSTPNNVTNKSSSSIIEFSPLLSSTVLNSTNMQQQANRFNITLSDVSEATEHDSTSFKELKEVEASTVLSDKPAEIVNNTANLVNGHVSPKTLLFEDDINDKAATVNKDDRSNTPPPAKVTPEVQPEKEDAEENHIASSSTDSIDGPPCLEGSVSNLIVDKTTTNNEEKLEVDQKKQEKPITASSSNTLMIKEILSSKTPVDLKSTDQIREDANRLLENNLKSFQNSDLNLQTTKSLPGNTTKTNLNTSYSKSMDDLTKEDASEKIDGKKFASTDNLDMIRISRTDPNFLADVGEYLATFPYQSSSHDTASKTKPVPSNRTSFGSYTQSSHTHGYSHSSGDRFSNGSSKVSDLGNLLSEPDRVEPQTRLSNGTGRFTSIFGQKFVAGAEARDQLESKDSSLGKQENTGSRDKETSYQSGSLQSKVEGILSSTAYLEQMKKDNPIIGHNISISPQNSPEKPMDYKKIQLDLLQIQKSLTSNKISDLSIKSSFDSGCSFSNQNTTQHPESNTSTETKTNSLAEVSKDPQHSSDAESTDIVPSTTSSTPEKTKKLMWDYAADIGYDDTGLFIGRNSGGSMEQPILSGNVDLSGSRLSQMRTSVFSINQRRSDNQAFVNCDQVDKNASHRTRYCSEGEETRTSSSSGHVDGDVSDKTESEVTLTEQDIDEPTRDGMEINNINILQTINQKHNVDNLIEALRAQRQAVEERYRTTGRYFSGQPHPNQSETQHAPAETRGLANQVQSILKKDNPSTQADGYLNDVFNQEKDLREKIFRRVCSDSSFSDTSLGLDDSSRSFTIAMDTVRRRLDLSNIPVTDTQQKPLVPRLDLKGKMSAPCNAESALTSHSIDYRTPKKHVIQCYPVYGYQKDQQNQPQNKYETRPIREGPVVRSDDPRDMWPQSGQVTNVTRGFESMGDSNFADKTNVTDSQFTSLRTQTSLTTVTSEKSQSDILSESGAETSLSTTDRRSASSPTRERGKSSPDWEFRHPEIPDLGGPVNSRRTAVYSTTDKEDIKERQSPVSPRYTSQDSDSSGIKSKSRFRPYRASSGHPFIESDTASIADSITTVESTHTGSDDAQGPELPRAVLGSRPDPKQQSGIYSKQTHQMSTLVTEPALSTIEEKSVTDEKSVESMKSSGSDQSLPRKPDDRQQIDSGLYTLSHGGHTISHPVDSGLYTLPQDSRTINQQADSGIHTFPQGTHTLNQQLNSGLYQVPQAGRPVDQQDDSGSYTVPKGGRTIDQHGDSRLYTVSQGGRSTGQQADSGVYSLPQGGRTINQQTLPQGNEMEEGVYSSLEGLIYDNEPDCDDVYSSLQDDSRNIDQQLVDENDYLIPQVKHKTDSPSQEQRSAKRNLFESNDQYRQSMEPLSPQVYEDVSDFKKTHEAMVQDVRNQRIMGNNPPEYSPGRHQKRESGRRSPFDDLYKPPPAQTHFQSQRSNSPYFEEMQFESNGHQFDSAKSKKETEIGYPGRVSPSGARSPTQVVSRDRGQYRDVDQQRLMEERESRQNGRTVSPIAMDTRNSPVSYIQNEKPDYTGSRLPNDTNDEIIMKPTKRTERRKHSERKRPQYGHDSTSEEEYLRGIDRTPHNLRAQRLRQALEQEIAQTHPQDLPAVWQRFSEIMPSEAESQVNPLQSEIYASLVTHPTKQLISQYFNERENSRQILEDRLAEEREYRHRQALNRPKKMSSSEDQLNSANFEQINASYAEILEALAAERAKRLHRETKAKSHSRSSQKQKHEKHSKTSKRSSQHSTENLETLYAIPEDQSNDTLAATSNSQSQDSRDLSVSDPMSTLKSKIRRQRDKIEKERRRELKRMEKLWKLEQLLKAKKSGLIGNFVLANNMNSISSTSTAASFSESPELLSGESTLTLSAHSGDISEDISTTVKDSSYEAHRVKLNRSKQKNAEEQYEAALRYLLSSGSSATLTDGEDSPSWLIKEEKKRRKMEKARSPKDKAKEKPVKLKEKGRKIVETRPKNHSSPYRVKDRKQKSPKKPESFEISPVKWDRESTRMSSPHKSSRSASLLHSLARDISPVKSSSKSARRSRDPSNKYHEESHRARSISPDRHHRSRGVQTSPKMRSRSCSPTYGDLQIISVPVLKKGKHGTRAVFMPRMYSSDMRENIPPKRIKKREKPKPPVSWYIPLAEEKRNPPNPLQERPPETQILDQRRTRGEWGMNNDQLKSPGWTIDTRVDRQERLDRQDKQDRLEQPVDNDMELLPLKTCMTLQDALLLNKKDFISQSRERQKRIALASEHRQMQDYLEAERDRIFGDRKRKGRQIEYPSGYKAETLYKFPKKKLFTKQEMKAITHRLYRRLPEVKYRELTEKRRQQYKLNRLRAMVFNRKVQNNVLRRAGIIA
ncbi:uncharacterized protein LOC126814996 [Patella vulgata]|uniref:uncharacterized protein LOC126814996 n=1 Tax=Patella vulgata TaxID=6465 RepID=UPI00217FD4FE|nr:uncharacterized protein LOC126814996 [Patella vulgata]